MNNTRKQAAYEQRRALRRQELASRGYTVTEPTTRATRTQQARGGEGEGDQMGPSSSSSSSTTIDAAASGKKGNNNGEQSKEASILDQWCAAAAACGFKLEGEKYTYYEDLFITLLWILKLNTVIFNLYF